jgi:5'-deoxynucleotidase YfbR-like HD superfamily hydrolase
MQYLQAVNAITEYEQIFAPVALAYREPQRVFILRQTAFAALEVVDASAIPTNYQLAQTYISTGAFDAAWEHCQAIRSLVERQRPEQAESIIKQIEADCKQQFRFTPAELQAEVKQRTDAWQKEVAQRGFVPQPIDPGKFSLNRAALALQVGLPRRALDEVINGGNKSVEASLLACRIYSQLGQHDIVWEEFMKKSPEVRAAFDATEINFRGALGEWCLGHPELAAQHRLAIAKIKNQEALESALDGSMRNFFGTSGQPLGNVLTGSMILQKAASDTFGIADQKVAAGLLYLEAGQPQRSAKLFSEAVRDIEPNTPWRQLLDRYYLQITGEVLK